MFVLVVVRFNICTILYLNNRCKEAHSRLLFHKQPAAADCIIAGSAAVPLVQCPLFPVDWYSFCRPRKDDKLSQPTWCEFNGWTCTQTQDVRATPGLPFITLDCIPDALWSQCDRNVHALSIPLDRPLDDKLARQTQQKHKGNTGSTKQREHVQTLE